MGLTLIEVAVLLAVIFILAALLLPGLANRGTRRNYKTECLSNMKQLQLCWNLYADNYNGTLLRNEPSDPASWVTGNMKTAAGATNLADLTNGVFFSYGIRAAVYKCPAAKGPTPSGLDGSLLVRTVSMTTRMGNSTDKYKLVAPAPPVLKMADITNPGPTNAAVFVDESVATVGDGFFAMDNVAKQMAFRNSPTLRHTGGATVSFADGHASWWIFTSETKEPFPQTVLPSQSNEWRQVYVSIYPPPP